jgi:hypothetical protein
MGVQRKDSNPIWPFFLFSRCPSVLLVVRWMNQAVQVVAEGANHQASPAPTVVVPRSSLPLAGVVPPAPWLWRPQGESALSPAGKLRGAVTLPPKQARVSALGRGPAMLQRSLAAGHLVVEVVEAGWRCSSSPDKSCGEGHAETCKRSPKWSGRDGGQRNTSPAARWWPWLGTIALWTF